MVKCVENKVLTSVFVDKRLRDYMQEKARINSPFVYEYQSTKNGPRTKCACEKCACENGKSTTNSICSKSRANTHNFHTISARSLPSNTTIQLATLKGINMGWLKNINIIYSMGP